MSVDDLLRTLEDISTALQRLVEQLDWLIGRELLKSKP